MELFKYIPTFYEYRHYLAKLYSQVYEQQVPPLREYRYDATEQDTSLFK